MRKLKRPVPAVHDGVYKNPEYSEITKSFEACGLCVHSSMECITTGVCTKTVDSFEIDAVGASRDPFNPYRNDGGKKLVVDPCP
ncbi:MAG: hypothetical protein WCW78_03950 [Candidatus Paceibacterota bacterium]|jgi:hypothetical protein